MTALVLRRLAGGALVLLAASVLTFALAEAAPGDFLDDLRADPRFSAAALEAARVRHGLDRPLPERYALWARSVLRGELGHSLAYDAPVWPLVRARLPRTLVLAAAGAALAWAAALLLGIAAAARPRGPADRLAGILSTSLLAVPEVVLMLLLLLLAARTGWFPVGGLGAAGSDALGGGARAAELGRHLLLPALSVAAGLWPVLVRHVRRALAEVLARPFIRAARAQGVPPARLLLRHALPAAANPLVTLLGSTVGALLGVSLLTEVVFAWPGLGPLLVEAILARDLHLVLGPVLASTALLVAGNLAADIVLALDPRVRAGRQ